MCSNLARKLLLGVAFLLPIYGSAGQYPDEAHATQTTVTVNIVWMPSFRAVHAICAAMMGESIVPIDDRTIVGCFNPSTTTIYAVQPTNFNDNFHLEILGHEFWHALGAAHPAI